MFNVNSYVHSIIILDIYYFLNERNVEAVRTSHTKSYSLIIFMASILILFSVCLNIACNKLFSRILYKEDGKDSFISISVSMSEQEAEQDWSWIQEELVTKV